MKDYTEQSGFKNPIQLDTEVEYKTESAYERRHNVIKSLSLKDKIEIAKDNDLLDDEYLTNLIYDSGVSLYELENTYGINF